MTDLDPTDLDFQEFASSGDPAALGRVFDATSDDLYRLALHLCGAPSTAEDLVQSTWLAAIEGAPGYDAGRPVRPWLSGILKNRARMHFRRESVRSRPLERAEHELSDPALEAERAELIAALDAGIAELSDVYGPVVRLHLRHGLSANAIGEALGRPAGTVRTQLVRGLDKLRGLLPAGLAGVAAALALPSRGLALVKREVLERVATPARTAAAAGGSGTAVAVWLRSAAAVAALTIVSIVAWQAFGEPIQDSADMDPIVATAPVEPASRDIAAPERDGAVDRASVGKQGQDPDVAMARVRGRVLLDDGSAVPDAEVLAFRNRTMRDANGYTKRSIGVGRTDSGGGFDFEIPAGSFWLVGRAPGLSHFEGVHGISDDGAELDELTLRLRPTIESSVLVLDPDGQPIAGQIVRFGHSYGTSQRTAHHKHSHLQRTGAGRFEGKTDAQGTLALEVPRDVGFWLTVDATEFASYAERHRLPEAGALQIRLARGDSIAGVVFLPDGQPAMGARVRFHGDLSRTITTGSDGRFKLGGLTLEGDEFVSVVHPDAAACCVQPLTVTDSLRIHLEAPQRVDGRVLDEDRAPLANAIVRVVGDRRVRSRTIWVGVEPTWEWACGRGEPIGTDDQGRFSFEHLYVGDFEVTAARKELHVGAVTVRASSGHGSVDIVLSAADELGAAIVGVITHAQTGAAIANAVVSVHPRDGGQARGVTADADGRFSMTGISTSSVQSIKIEAEGFVATRIDRQLARGENGIDVALAPAIDAKLRLKTRDGEAVARAELSLRRSSGELFMFKFGTMGVSKIRTDADGLVGLSAVPMEQMELIVQRTDEDPVTLPIDLAAFDGTVLEMLLDAPVEKIQFMLFVVAGERDVAPMDFADIESRARFMQLLQEGAIRDPGVRVEAQLHVKGGRWLCTSSATPASWDDVRGGRPPAQAVGKLRPYVDKTKYSGGSMSGSARPMPFPELELRGRAQPMTLVITAAGFLPVEIEIDGAAEARRTAVQRSSIRRVVTLRRAE